MGDKITHFSWKLGDVTTSSSESPILNSTRLSPTYFTIYGVSIGAKNSTGSITVRIKYGGEQETLSTLIDVELPYVSGNYRPAAWITEGFNIETLHKLDVLTVSILGSETTYTAEQLEVSIWGLSRDINYNTPICWNWNTLGNPEDPTVIEDQMRFIPFAFPIAGITWSASSTGNEITQQELVYRGSNDEEWQIFTTLIYPTSKTNYGAIQIEDLPFNTIPAGTTFTLRDASTTSGESTQVNVTLWLGSDISIATDLKVDEQTTPAIINKRPMISWTYYNPLAVAQRAFRVQVSKSNDFSTIEYDSTKIISPSTSHQITVSTSGRHYVRVRVWD